MRNTARYITPVKNKFTESESSPKPISLLDLVPDLKRVSVTEYCSPCPFCGGTDRLRCWPARDRFWCRQCGKKGDVVQFLRDRDGLTFVEAYRAATGDDTSPLHSKPRASVHDIALQRAKKCTLNGNTRRMFPCVASGTSLRSKERLRKSATDL